MNQRVDREQVAFKSEGDVTLAGYLYRPTGQPAEPPPCVVMAHGFSGTMDRLFRYAEWFAQAGMAVLAFDYRNFGASGAQPRQLIDLEGQQADWRATIGFAHDHQDLDPRRIALWGSSLGGAHAITIAAADPALAAVVAQVPWLGDGRSTGRKLRHALRLTSLKVTVAAMRGRHPSQAGPAAAAGARPGRARHHGHVRRSTGPEGAGRQGHPGDAVAQRVRPPGSCSAWVAMRLPR